MNRRATVLGLLASTITLVSCGGGTTPTQPDPTAAVASVSVSAPSTTLMPQQTAQLAVALRSADGASLTGRAITYGSSAPQTASVSASGLVTALAVGTTTITATSEGKSGTIDFTVASGTVVGSSGGTVTGGNGAVVLTIPPGALATNTPISIVAVVGTPPAAPVGVQFNGTAYQIGTAALTFAQPVTITLKYDAATLPLWVMSGDLGLLGSGTTGWTSLSGIVVDTAAKTVSGTTTSIGGGGGGARAAWAGAALSAATPPMLIIAVNPATVTLTPVSDSVNPQKRSVMFHASIVPVGAPVTVPIPGATAPKPLWRYRWRTTGQNGTLAGGTTDTGWMDSPDMQYICTNANLNILTGKMDDVILEVLLNPGTENDPANQQIVRAQGSVFAGLSKTFEITPLNTTIGPGVSQPLQFIVRNAAGNILPTDANTRFTWNNVGDAGNIILNGTRPDLVTYQAKSTFTSPPPRIDSVACQVNGVATVSERSVVWDFSNLLQPKLVVDRTQTVTYTLQGAAHTFVTVHVDYTVSLQPGNPTIEGGATQGFSVTLTPAYNGPGLAYVWTSPGTHGTLSETNGNHSANKQATYTAKPLDPGGADPISVKVVSYLAGTELETLGTGTASVVVTPPKPAWRLTSFTLTNAAPRTGFLPADGPPWDAQEALLARVVQTPSDGMIFLEDNVLFSEHAVYFQIAPPGQGKDALYYVSGSYVTLLARAAPIQFSHYNSTGTMTNGAIDGVGYTSNVMGNLGYTIELNSIVAQKNGDTMTGTITVSPYSIGGGRTYSFVATLLTPH